MAEFARLKSGADFLGQAKKRDRIFGTGKKKCQTGGPMQPRVNEQHVKQQLRQQQQTWETEQLAAGCSELPALEFWSVGKLLRVLKASKAAADPLEALAQYGITRHSVGSVDQRRATSQPTAAETQHVPTADSVTYTSSHVWITGFLHFGEDLDNCDTLQLCDNNSKLPSFLLDPSPQLVDQLVLVKRWVLVDKAFGGVRTPDSMFLEVHGEKPMSLLSVSGLYVDWTQEEVLDVLETNYQTKDPPMYTGTEPWAAVATHSRGIGSDSNAVQAVVIGESDELSTPSKHKKRKRVHAVFGRVTSVSPISRQKDRASSHFFVEIECCRGCNESMTESVVNVMFTGVHSMRWHLFLRPGKIVLLTDLVKVLSRECEMFLLQTTRRYQSGHLVEAEKWTMDTLVLVWNETASPQKSAVQWINDSLDIYSKRFVSRCSGKLLDYEGKVCRLLWDECIELQGADQTRVIVCLFHFPYEQELVRLRKGASVRICGAHVLRLPTPVGGRLVIGLCPRSHFAISAYGDPSCPCIAMGTRSRRGRAHKKWSRLGDFHRQSMVLSIWLLELIELLDAKFLFGEDDQMRLRSSFPRTRRRQAAAHVAKKLHFSLRDDRIQAAMTLGALFLKCHPAKAGNCVMLQLPPCEKLLTCNRALTIRELQVFGESKLNHTAEATPDRVRTFDEFQSMRISAENLDWCLLFGCIRGNIDSGDLEIYDRTGSIPLRLNGSEMLMNLTGERGMYLIRNFDLMVEDYNQLKELQQEDKTPLVYIVICSVADVEFISIHDDEAVSFSPEEKAAPAAQEPQEVVLLVTHVDALPLSSIRSAGLLPEYRVFHGIVCPVGEELQPDRFMKSVCTADILVNTECTNWYMQKGGCYRIKALGVSKDAEARSPPRNSVEGQAVKISIDYWEKSMVAEDRLCFDSLNHFRYKIGGESINEERLFRVYRVETGQHSIVPIKLECNNFKNARCGAHELCQQDDRNVNGMVVAPVVKQTSIEVAIAEFMAMSILRYFLQQSEKVSQVCSLLHHPLANQSQLSVDDGKRDEERSVVMTVDLDLHKPHLVSVVGVIKKKNYYWWSNAQQQSLGSVGQTATIGVKRARELDSSIAGGPSRRLTCILHVRDLQHLDTVEIRVDASRFGVLGMLQLDNVVEFTRLQGFIARSSYKVFLSWSHYTAARLVSEGGCLSVRDAELYGSIPTAFLNDLYHASYIDRMLHRYVVGVMHISYVLLKRKCGLCHQALQLDKRRGCWKHAEPQAASKYSRDCAWRWQQMAPSDPTFRARTYMGTTARCIIDDGSGQAELFLEKDVAWELLTCTAGQRRRFEDILSNYVDELSYFSGRTVNGSFATSKAVREQEYYQNELRAFVLNVIPSLRSIVVFAQRFYSAKQKKEDTSVLTFGKDIHITTKTVPQPKLEAKRVDRVHVRNELKRRLTQLRLRLSSDND